MKNQYIRVELPKKGELGQFVNLRGGLAKRRGWCFSVGVNTQCTLWSHLYSVRMVFRDICLLAFLKAMNLTGLIENSLALSLLHLNVIYQSLYDIL